MSSKPMQQNRPRQQNRGGGRGGGHQGDGGMDKENRYAEGISEAMKEKVIKNNESDDRGPTLVEHWSLYDATGNKTSWQKVESLSKTTKYYYSHTATDGTVSSTVRPPDEVLGYTEKFDESRSVNYVNPGRVADFSANGLKTINVTYNSFKCSNFDEIKAFNVYTYTVDFDPEIPAKGNGEKRRKVLLMLGSRKDSRMRRDELFKKLGHWEFNNQVMHVLAKSKPDSPIVLDCGSHKCRMCIVSQGSLETMDDDKVRSYFLSLFTRRKLDGADYTRLDRRDGGSWFPRDHIGKTENIGSHEYMAVLGFDVSNHYTMNNDFVMTAEMRAKCIDKRTVLQSMEFIRKKNSGDYKSAISRYFRERNVMVVYNKQRTRIDEIDFDSQENTPIPDMEGGVTYKTYLQQRYNVNSPHPEMCVLITVDRRTGSRSGFLPQHCHVMFENDADKANVQDAMKELAKESLGRRFPRISDFTRDIAKERPRNHGKKKDWKGLESLAFSFEPEVGQAVLLPQPGIRIMFSEDRRGAGRLKTFDYIHTQVNKIGQQWSKSKGPIKPKQMKSWTVVIAEQDKAYTVKERNGRASIKEHILKELKSYRQGRGIRPEFLPDPTFKFLNINRSKVAKAKPYWLASPKGDAVILGILPEGDLCSQQKQEMTRAYTMSDSKRPRPTQFCQIGRFNSVKYFAKTQFDMIMLKNGNRLFELVPKLSKNTIFQVDEMWCIGIAVDVNPDNGHPPVACVTLMTSPMAGELTAIFPVCHFMDFRKRIIPYDIMAEMVEDVITRGHQKTGKLPKQILVFREGISEGQFPEMYSKEITAIKKTINVRMKEKFKAANFKPKFCFLCVQKGIIDRAGIPKGRGKIADPLEPMLCFMGPLSRKHWDFLLHVVCEKRGGAKPVKYTILNENIGLKKHAKNEAIIDLFNIVHALHYGYCESIPFQNGPSAIPSPIKYSMHNAQFMHELIRECDQAPGKLSAHKRLSFRPRVLDWDHNEEEEV